MSRLVPCSLLRRSAHEADLSDRYDFGPLPVLNQGKTQTCWYHMWATQIGAFTRKAGLPAPWDPDPDSLAKRFADDVCEQYIDTDIGSFLTRNISGCDDDDTFDVRERILAAGVLLCNVPSSMRSFWGAVPVLRLGKWKMPVIKVRVDDLGSRAINHTLVAVGYTSRGVIVQNSWGKYWGKNGRAILSWEWIAEFDVRFEQHALLP